MKEEENNKKSWQMWKDLRMFLLIVFGPPLIVLAIHLLGFDISWPIILSATYYAASFAYAAIKGKDSYRYRIMGDPPPVQTRNYFMRKYELRKEQERWEAAREERQAYLLKLRHRIVQRLIPILIVAFIVVLAIIILKR
jgi:hypothetical protein